MDIAPSVLQYINTDTANRIIFWIDCKQIECAAATVLIERYRKAMWKHKVHTLKAKYRDTMKRSE